MDDERLAGHSKGRYSDADRHKSRSYESSYSTSKDKDYGRSSNGHKSNGSSKHRDRPRSPYGEPPPSRSHANGNGDEGGSREKRRRVDEPQERASTSGGAPAGAGDGNNTRKTRDRCEIVVSRDKTLVTKKGTTGQNVQLTANFFRLIKRPSWSLFQYRVDFEPTIELAGLRKRLIYEQKPTLGGYLYDTENTVYLAQKLETDPLVVVTKDREEKIYTITFKRVAVVGMDSRESLQVLNIILRRAMEGLKLQLVGRNFFDAAAKVTIYDHKIQLWPGYLTSIRQHEVDVMLCAEITHKVMRTETLYNIMGQMLRAGGNFKEDFTNQVLGMTVLTDYNNKTYRIDDINFDIKPSDTFQTKAGPTTYIDYYKRKYNIQIRDPAQPLLISKAKAKDIRGGQSEMIALVPELCRVTGLSENQRKDNRLMQDMARYFRMGPEDRIRKLKEFNDRLSRTPESVDVLRQFNFQLDTNLVQLPGRVLKNENIVYGDRVKLPASMKADWQNAFRDHSMHTSVPLVRWTLICPNRCRREADMFLNDLMKVSRGMRFEISRPNIAMISDDRSPAYISAIETSIRNDPQLLMVLVPNNTAERYAIIKKKCCVERSVPTQVICHRTLQRKGLMSIATKVAIQLNCKLGGAPWMIEMPLSGLMTVGIDVSRDTRDRNKSYGALVATMDLKQSVRFYSTVSQHKNGEELSNELCLNMTKALKAFKTEHNCLPRQICIYRDGVGEGQTRYVYEYEIMQLKSKLEIIYKSAGDMTYKLCFIIVSKRINTRIFNGRQNPGPGTVVDDIITLPERYDFFLVSQSVNQGTVSPTSYNVLFDNMGLPPDKLQQLTYKQTHLYYNWAGTTRVPAVCQYASKLAFLVGQHIHQSPSDALERKLYFL